MLRSGLFATVLSAAFLAGGLAHANGRFPEALELSFQRGADAHRIAVSVTFGLLLSDDDGATFRWVCEDAVGYRGIWDPLFIVAPTGTLFASTPSALRISRDGGCTWNPGPGETATAWVADLFEAADDSIWVAVANTAGGNDVYVSSDDGATFEPQGLLASAPTAFWKSVRVAPSDPTRVYVAGYTNVGDEPSALLYRRDPEGWTALPFSAGTASQVRFLAVSPDDPDLVFARIDGEPTDTLLRSDDGAVSWTPVTSVDGDIQTFQIFQGGEIFLGTKYEGTQRSIDNGLTFTENSERRMTLSGRCGHEGPDGQFWVCGANWDPDRFALGKSNDRGRTYTRLMRFNEIRQALDCPDGTPQDEICEGDFQGICDMFACTGADAAPLQPDAPPLSDAAPGSGGDGGGGCGCGVALAGVLVWPFRRRKRRGTA